MENNVVQIGQIDRTQNPNTSMVIRYATAFEHKLEMLKNEIKQHGKRVGAFSLVLLGISYWLQLQLGSQILWILGATNFGFWIFFVWSFWTNPTETKALAMFSTTVSVISFLISLVLPAIQKTTIAVPKIGIAIVNPVKKDTTVILSIKGVTEVPHRKNIEASTAMFGDKNVKTVEDGRSTIVNASVEANEGKYTTDIIDNSPLIDKDYYTFLARLIKFSEGCKLTAYRDGSYDEGTNWSIGFGANAGIGKTPKIASFPNKEVAWEYCLKEVELCKQAAMQDFPMACKDKGVWYALTDLYYNAGKSIFKLMPPSKKASQKIKNRYYSAEKIKKYLFAGSLPARSIIEKDWINLKNDFPGHYTRRMLELDLAYGKADPITFKGSLSHIVKQTPKL